MKLSVSNIAWDVTKNNAVYDLMKKYDYLGLEIAPTKIFPSDPYNKIEQAKLWAEELNNEYGFKVSSMQSIWFGRQEVMFNSDDERSTLLEYTKKAICFAEAVGCNNLVFGCPRNRNIPAGKNADAAIDFFKEIGEYAFKHSTVIGMEANPPIYNTNFINSTLEAFDLIKEIDSPGFKLNLDVGTMIQNNETVDILQDNISLINHTHISEPGLRIIEERNLHSQLYKCLHSGNYDNFVSIEIGTQDDISMIEKSMIYVKEIFG